VAYTETWSQAFCRFALSSDRGDTWSPSVDIVPHDPDVNYYRPRVAVNATGQWTATMLWQVPFSQVVRSYLSSSDDGLAWSPLVEISTATVDPVNHDLVLDEARGYRYIVWSEGPTHTTGVIKIRTDAPPGVPVKQSTWGSIKAQYR
jgi:hypothetical protein